MKNVLLLLLLCLFALQAPARQASVTYTKPYQYEKRSNGLKVKAWVKPGIKISGKPTASFNNSTAEVIAVQGDSIGIWLPLTGSQGELKITDDKKQILADQMYIPLISDDWGYFANGTIHIISSSHQDIAWMNTPDSCRHERINDIIVPGLKMMETDNKFAFGMEQTLNLMEFLDEFPDKKDEVIKRYKEGRFSWGATLNQPYEGLESGEQLVRQAYFGRKWIRENLPGCDDRTAYNIDVPGRTLQMPQIYAKSGINNLFISRMREGLYDWYAPDGSKVFTYTPGNYGWAIMIWKFFDENGVTALNKMHARAELWSDYFKQHNIPPHYAIVISTDASGPSNYKKVIDEWNAIADMADVPLPRLQHSTAEGYFNKVNVSQSKLEKVSGERPDLWLYIHGPAHYQAIAAKRRAAVLLPAAEAFSAFDCLLGNDMSSYPSKSLADGWYSSIYPDHGWGGRNGHITDSIFRASLEKGEAHGQQVLDKALNSIANKVKSDNNAILVFNDLSWERSTEASVKVDAATASTHIIKDASGRIVPSQLKTENGEHKIVFNANNVPSMGYSTFYLVKGKTEKANTAKVLPNYYENEYYKMTFGNGGILSWYDKQIKKELVNTTKFSAGDVLNLGYTGNGAGEFTQITPVTPGDIFTLTSMNALWDVVENGALYCVYENKQSYKETKVIQRIIVYHKTKKVDFDIVLDFDGTHGRQFRFALPLNMKNGIVNYEVPMAVLQVGRDEMKTKPGGWAWGGSYTQSPEEIHPREIQNFISLNGNGFGITMSSEVAVADWVDPSREAAEYDVLQGILISSHKSCHGEGNWYEQKGTHRFRFSVKSHEQGWENGYKFGMEANRPFHTVLKAQKTSGQLPLSKSFISVSDEFTVINTIKKADNGNELILRMTEMKGKSSSPQISVFMPVQSLTKTDLIESEIGKTNLSGTTFKIEMGNNSIETFKFQF